MRIPLDLMTLHEPLFIDGTNFKSPLLERSGKGTLGLWYDTDLKVGLVMFKDKLSIIPNIASAQVKDPKVLGFEVAAPVMAKHRPEQVSHPMQTGTAVKAQIAGPDLMVRTAQVETPQAKANKRGTRPAKFQGEESQGE